MGSMFTDKTEGQIFGSSKIVDITHFQQCQGKSMWNVKDFFCFWFLFLTVKWVKVRLPAVVFELFLSTHLCLSILLCLFKSCKVTEWETQHTQVWLIQTKEHYSLVRASLSCMFRISRIIRNTTTAPSAVALVCVSVVLCVMTVYALRITHTGCYTMKEQRCSLIQPRQFFMFLTRCDPKPSAGHHLLMCVYRDQGGSLSSCSSLSLFLSRRLAPVACAVYEKATEGQGGEEMW